MPGFRQIPQEIFLAELAEADKEGRTLAPMERLLYLDWDDYVFEGELRSVRAYARRWRCSRRAAAVSLESHERARQLAENTREPPDVRATSEPQASQERAGFGSPPLDSPSSGESNRIEPSPPYPPSQPTASGDEQPEPALFPDLEPAPQQPTPEIALCDDFCDRLALRIPKAKIPAPGAARRLWRARFAKVLARAEPADVVLVLDWLDDPSCFWHDKLETAAMLDQRFGQLHAGAVKARSGPPAGERPMSRSERADQADREAAQAIFEELTR